MHTLHARRARIEVALGAMAEAIADYDRALQTASSHDAMLLLRERAAAHRVSGDDARAADDERQADRIAERLAGGP